MAERKDNRGNNKKKKGNSSQMPQLVFTQDFKRALKQCLSSSLGVHASSLAWRGNNATRPCLDNSIHKI